MLKKILYASLFISSMANAGQQDVIGNTYELSTINEINVQSQFRDIPYITFDQDNYGNIIASGHICNDFSGTIQIHDDKSVSSDIAPEGTCADNYLGNFQSSIPDWFKRNMIQEDNGVLTIITNGAIIKMNKVN